MTGMAMRDKIIDYIDRNRVSSTEVADALGKTGAVPGVVAVNRRHFKVGKVFWAYAFGGTNWHVHEQIQSAGEGDVVFIEAFDCGDKAIFGDLVSKYLLLYKQASAIVVTGMIRDVHRLVKENWPIWSCGFNPVGCVNENRPVAVDPEVLEDRRRRYSGAVAVCDDTGVVVIPCARLTEEFLDRLHFLEEQEDLWYECIDRKKWSTFDAVCLKKYLEQPAPFSDIGGANT
jgi:regulator of RNase E activity RraA